MSISKVCLLFLPACLYKDDLDSICFVLNAAHQGLFTLVFALQVTAPICLLGIKITVCTIWEQENSKSNLPWSKAGTGIGAISTLDVYQGKPTLKPG